MNPLNKIIVSLTIALTFFSSTLLHAEENKVQLHISGPDNAKIVIQEFLDYECLYCSRGSDVMKELVKNYPNDIKLIIRNFPMPFHASANKAAQAISAVYLQSPALAEKFHYDLMKQQSQFVSQGEKLLYTLAHKIGVNVAKMKIDMNGSAVSDIMQQDATIAKYNGFNATPSFLIGDTKVQGAYDYEHFKNIVEQKLKK